MDIRLEQDWKVQKLTCQDSISKPDCLLQETRTYWFNPSSLEDEDEFMLVGLVLGLAIYNAVLLDFPLPLALYRKLIGQTCTLRDLQDMEPTLGKSLTALLQYEGKFLALGWSVYTCLTTLQADWADVHTEGPAGQNPHMGQVPDCLIAVQRYPAL